MGKIEQRIDYTPITDQEILESMAEAAARGAWGNSGVIHCPVHPCANAACRVPRSHMVWEFAHHQFLPRCFVIHHINGIHDDNRLENLAPMFNCEHSRWHRWDS